MATTQLDLTPKRYRWATEAVSSGAHIGTSALLVKDARAPVRRGGTQPSHWVLSPEQEEELPTRATRWLNLLRAV